MSLVTARTAFVTIFHDWRKAAGCWPHAYLFAPRRSAIAKQADFVAHQSPFISCAYLSHTLMPIRLIASIFCAIRLACVQRGTVSDQIDGQASKWRRTTACVMLPNPPSGMRASASGGFPACCSVEFTYLSCSAVDSISFVGACGEAAPTYDLRQVGIVCLNLRVCTDL